MLRCLPDALLFVDSCVHGSAMRVLPGSRRVIILRYGPRIASAWEAPPHVMDRIGETSPHSAKTQEASMLCSDDDTVMKKANTQTASKRQLPTSC